MFSKLVFIAFNLSLFQSLYALETIYNILDDFKHESVSPSSIYYSSVVQGSAFTDLKFVSDTNSDDTALQLQYQFTSKNTNDFIEVLMNYGTKTKDLTCTMPYGMSIKLKIDSPDNFNGDIFKFMLIEDNNSNGYLDLNDEVYAYSFNLASVKAGEWFELIMPYDNFQVFYTTSVLSNLSLNKIRAWRLTIFNQAKDDKLKTIQFKEVKQLCHATYHTNEINSQSYIRTMFIQLWNIGGCSCGTWTSTRWTDEIAKMKASGIERLIVQYTIYDTHVWYAQIYGGKSTIHNIMDAADSFSNFEVVLGLYFNEQWNTFNKYDKTHYDFLLAKHQSAVDDLLALFKSRKSFGGFYIPQEWNNVEWKDDLSLTWFSDWTKNVASYIKSKGDYRIIISPFLRNYIKPSITQNLYNKFMLAVKRNATHSLIDEITIQDSIGVDQAYRNSFIDVYSFFEVLKPLCDTYNIKFGANVELFEQIGSGSFSASPAKISRLKEQMRIAKFFTDDITAFDWTYMMSKNYELYQNYLNAKKF